MRSKKSLQKLSSKDLIHLLVGAGQISVLTNGGQDTPAMKKIIKELLKRMHPRDWVKSAYND